MPAINFPDTPAVNDEFTANGRTWIWTGTTWDTVETESVTGTPGGFDSTQVVESVGTSRALTSADAGKLITNSAAITITVEGLSVGKQVDFLQMDTNKITFVAGSGTTLVSAGNYLKTAQRYSPASIKCVASNSYVLLGDLGA